MFFTKEIVPISNIFLKWNVLCICIFFSWPNVTESLCIFAAFMHVCCLLILLRAAENERRSDAFKGIKKVHQDGKSYDQFSFFGNFYSR